MSGAKDVLSIIQTSIEDSKGDNPVVIDLNGKSSIADFMIVVSGTSQRHVSAMATRITENLKEKAGLSAKIEGQDSGDWVLIDAGNIVVHLFRPEVRDFYSLEKMWGLDLPSPHPASSASSSSLHV